MPIVIEPGLNADAFCLQLKQAIQDMGLAKAFGLGHIVIAYSGPSGTLREVIATGFTDNWSRAKQDADRHGGRRIDDTAIGQFLATFDFRTYFTDFYGNDRSLQERAEFEIWGFASSEFMRARFKQLATAVCGADPERVFRKYEIAAVLKNRRVRIINNRPVTLFKQFHKIHPDEAYRLFCLTELLEARRYAQKEGTAEAWNDYRERRGFFMTERQYTASQGMSSLKKDKVKLDKRRALVAYSLSLLSDSAPLELATQRRVRAAKTIGGPV